MSGAYGGGARERLLGFPLPRGDGFLVIGGCCECGVGCRRFGTCLPLPSPVGATWTHPLVLPGPFLSLFLCECRGLPADRCVFESNRGPAGTASLHRRTNPRIVFFPSLVLCSFFMSSVRLLCSAALSCPVLSCPALPCPVLCACCIRSPAWRRDVAWNERDWSGSGVGLGCGFGPWTDGRTVNAGRRRQRDRRLGGGGGGGGAEEPPQQREQ